ncbi:type II toxin-antitoxin system HipA family toxin [Actinomyces slackii]|uniref:Serine/threonine-protein kinase HipA n=1 Tax=Actinomyces slackii TaxID=52774 RepID=A0A3S4UML4_9ACTO|nr:HipA domain-containing protein [Actinomyces slackii]VEG74072.1 Serine/threonine-protein kinase HipA [Actinomyces slackii]
MKEEIYAVTLHGEHVGVLSRRDAVTKFVFDDDYWSRPGRAVLGRWFEEHQRAWPHAMNRVPAWFSNLLPEGRLRDLIAHEQGVNAYAEMDLLARIGGDLPGAVAVDLDDTSEVDAVFEGAVSSDVPQPLTAQPRRASLAGMALKFSVRHEGDRLALPVRGEDGDWILKTPDSQYPDLPANEYAIMRLADRVGIEVPELALWDRSSIDELGPGAWPNDETLAYAIRRFDRSDHGRIHIEDFAQVRGTFGAEEGKYRSAVEEIAVLAYSGHDHASLQEMVRRTAFNLLAGNGDAHLKNWSLIYPDRRAARLSPAYDLVCTAPYLGQPEDPHLALPFFGARTLSSVTREHFARLQDVLRVGREDVLDVLDETLERFRQTWAEEPDAPDAVTVWISAHLEATSTRLHGA